MPAQTSPSPARRVRLRALRTAQAKPAPAGQPQQAMPALSKSDSQPKSPLEPALKGPSLLEASKPNTAMSAMRIYPLGRLPAGMSVQDFVLQWQKSQCAAHHRHSGPPAQARNQSQSGVGPGLPSLSDKKHGQVASHPQPPSTSLEESRTEDARAKAEAIIPNEGAGPMCCPEPRLLAERVASHCSLMPSIPLNTMGSDPHKNQATAPAGGPVASSAAGGDGSWPPQQMQQAVLISQPPQGPFRRTSATGDCGESQIA